MGTPNRMKAERFVVKIDLGNEAVQTRQDVRVIMEKLRNDGFGAHLYDKIRDANGNTVGFWAFVSDELPKRSVAVVEALYAGKGTRNEHIARVVTNFADFNFILSGAPAEGLRLTDRILIEAWRDDSLANYVGKE